MMTLDSGLLSWAMQLSIQTYYPDVICYFHSHF